MCSGQRKRSRMRYVAQTLSSISGFMVVALCCVVGSLPHRATELNVGRMATVLFRSCTIPADVRVGLIIPPQKLHSSIMFRPALPCPGSCSKYMSETRVVSENCAPSTFSAFLTRIPDRSQRNSCLKFELLNRVCQQLLLLNTQVITPTLAYTAPDKLWRICTIQLNLLSRLKHS
jgi:hypothetical protein